MVQNPRTVKEINIANEENKIDRRSLSDSLPGVLNTDLLQKFLKGTGDNLFQPELTEKLSGFVGRVPSHADLIKDFYIKESTKERREHQLEPTMISTDPDTGEITNVSFYDDIVNLIRFQGGIIDNQDRLFETETYSWMPPINPDMLMNYTNYFWFPSGPDVIRITEVTNIGSYIGSSQSVVVEGNDLIDGTRIILENDLSDEYNNRVYVVGGVGTSFTLSIDSELSTAGWDDSSVGWDDDPWDGVDSQLSVDVENQDYIVMERGAKDANLWSTQNKWYHGDDLNGTQLTIALERQALRPIIEFDKDLELYNHGTFGRSAATVRDDITTSPLSTIIGHQTVTIDDIQLKNGDKILFTNLPSLFGSWDSFGWDLESPSADGITALGITHPQYGQDGFEWATGSFDPSTQVVYSAPTGDITLTESGGQGIVITVAENFTTLGFVPGMVISLSGTTSNNKNYTIDTIDGTGKIMTFVESLIDSSDLTVSNVIITEKKTVYKNRVFELNGLGTASGATLTIVTDGQSSDGSPINGDQIKILLGTTHQGKVYYWSDEENFWIEAQQKLSTNQAPLFQLYDTKGNTLQDPGEYPLSTFAGGKIFSYQINSDVRQALDAVLGIPLKFNQYGEITFENHLVTDRYTYNSTLDEIMGFYFYKNTMVDDNIYGNAWHLNENSTRQYIIDTYDIIDTITNQLTLSVEPTDTNITIYINGIETTDGWTNSGNIITLTDTLAKNDIVKVRYYSTNTLSDTSIGVYETPINLTANPDNIEVDYISNSEYFKHFTNTIKYQLNLIGSPNGANNWRNTTKDKRLGTEILQHKAPMLRLLTLGSDKNIDYMLATRYVEREYSRFRNKFLRKISEYIRDGIHSDTQAPSEWIEDALTSINLGKINDFPFSLSGMGTRTDGEPTYHPSSPSRLGIYPVYTPGSYIDDTYTVSRKVLQMHDGSIIIAFNDFRDDVILEFENNIYDSIPSEYKTEDLPDYDWKDYISTRYTTNDYSIEEFNKLLTPIIQRWATFNDLDLTVNNIYSEDDPFTWNYSKQGLPGYWRGIYNHYYGTDRPNTHPWEMFDFTQKPDWWEPLYGIAPYTAGNILLWNNVSTGTIPAGDRAGTYQRYARTDAPIPVNGAGELLNPIELGVVEQPGVTDAQAKWAIGDYGPVESIFRRSEYWSFAITQISYLVKPTRFIEFAWDAKRALHRYNNQTNSQWINTDTEDRQQHSELLVHGEVLTDGTTYLSDGIQQWITNYVSNNGQSIVEKFGDVIRNVGVQLAHKMGGYINENSSQIIADNFGLVPQEDINVLLYNSPSIKEEVYSGVIIERVATGWSVIGYDVLDPKFNMFTPIKTSQQYAIDIGTIRVLETSDYNNNIIEVPYGTIYTSQQDLYDFLIGYGRYLEDKGWIFDKYDPEQNEVNNWRLSGKQFLFWSQGNWEQGSLLALSPLAEGINFRTDHGSVSNVEQIINGVYSILDREGGVINPEDTMISRSLDTVSILPINNTFVYAVRLFVSEYEHIITFENSTIFNDLIYDPLLNLRQDRFKIFASRAGDWRGRFEAPGYIITDSTIIPNFEKSVNDIRRYFDIENVVEREALQDSARRLIGFQTREYLDDLRLSSDTQFQFYQGFIRQKGTRLVIDKLFRSDFTEDSGEIGIFEEWAFRLGEFGAVQDSTTTELILKDDEWRAEPQLIDFKNTTTSAAPDSIYDDVIEISTDDTRWVVRPPYDGIARFPFRSPTAEKRSKNAAYLFTSDISVAGYPLDTEVTHHVNTITERNAIFDTQRITVEAVDLAFGDTIWVDNISNFYNINDADDISDDDALTVFNHSFMVYRYTDTGLSYMIPVLPKEEEATIITTSNVIVSSVTVNTPGIGYSVGDVLAASDGTSVTVSTATIINVQLVDAAPATVGSVYAVGDLLTLSTGTGTAGVIEVVTTQAITAIINAVGAGYGVGDALVNDTGAGTQATFNVDSVSTIAGQDETNYDNSPTTEGTFVGGDGAAGNAHVASDIIVMNDGTRIQIDTIDGNGDAVTFTILSASTSGIVSNNQTLTWSSLESGTGTDTAFTLTLGSSNQEIFAISLTTGGSYRTDPTLTASTTTVDNSIGVGATVNLTLGIDGTTINTAGNYTVVPTDSTHTNGGEGGGTGTNATFTQQFGALTTSLTVVGEYLIKPSGFVTGGTGDGAILDWVFTKGHGFTDGQVVMIDGDSGTSPDINGSYTITLPTEISGSAFMVLPALISGLSIVINNQTVDITCDTVEEITDLINAAGIPNIVAHNSGGHITLLDITGSDIVLEIGSTATVLGTVNAIYENGHNIWINGINITLDTGLATATGVADALYTNGESFIINGTTVALSTGTNADSAIIDINAGVLSPTVTAHKEFDGVVLESASVIVLGDIIGTVTNPTYTNGQTIVINGITVTLSTGTTLDAAVIDINNETTTDVSVENYNGKLIMGSSVDILLAEGSGTALADLGFTPGTYASARADLGLGFGTHGLVSTLDDAITDINSAKSNLFTNPNDFDLAPWATSQSSITPNALLAPDSTLTADKLVEDGTTNQHMVRQTITVELGETYTLSVEAKIGERTALFLTSQAEGYSIFDISNGTIIQDGGNVVSIEATSQGYYKCSATITKTNTTGNFYIGLYNAATNYLGDGSSGLYLWNGSVIKSDVAAMSAINDGGAIRITDTVSSLVLLEGNGTALTDLGFNIGTYDNALTQIGFTAGTYSTVSINNIVIQNTIKSDTNTDIHPGTLGVFTESRFVDLDSRDAAVINTVLGTLTFSSGDYVYVDSRTRDNPADIIDLWEVYTSDGIGGWATTQYDNVDRTQTLRVDIELFKHSILYNKDSNVTDMNLNIYDPAKGLFPSQLLKELSYKISYDPAKYTDGDDTVFQIDPYVAWGEEQIGKAWWDLSNVEYVNYETGSDRYRRNNWGQLIDGRSIDVYEWVKSIVAPLDWATHVDENIDLPEESFVYKPSGEAYMADTSENPPYVQKTILNEVTNEYEIYYYFWVKNSETIPNVSNRDKSVAQLSRDMTSPTSSGIPWFAAISENAIVVSGIQDLLTPSDSVLQLNYGFTRTDINLHREWVLSRDGDENDIPTDRFWNKMRDSLVGYDVNNGTVPDPSLEESRKYGNFIRPRQSWFIDRTEAIPIFIQAVNDLLVNQCIVDERSTIFDNLHNVSTVPTLYVAANIVITSTNTYPIYANSETIIINGTTVTLSTGTDILGAVTDITTAAITGVTATNVAGVLTLTSTESSITLAAGATGTVLTDLGLTAGTTYARLDCEYDQNVADTIERDALVTSSLIVINDHVWVDGTTETSGFWKVYRYDGIDSVTLNPIFTETCSEAYKVSDFWSLKDYYAEGVSSSVIINETVDTITERNALTAIDGLIVKVNDDNSDSSNIWAIYQYDSTDSLNSWIQIAKKECTIEFDVDLFTDATYGNVDVTTTRNGRDQALLEVVDALRVDILSDLEQNQVFYTMLRYVYSEQALVDWAFKTSYILAVGFNKSAHQDPILVSDTTSSIIEFIEEAKPYHTKLRDFITNEDFGIELYSSRTTDFDKPVYVEADSSTRVLDATVQADIDIMNAEGSKQYDWFNNYLNDSENIRSSNITLLFDRVSCETSGGWDNLFGWDSESNVSWDLTTFDANETAADRIIRYYQPQPLTSADVANGEIDPLKNISESKDVASLISGCGFKGTIIDGDGFVIDINNIDTYLNDGTFDVPAPESDTDIIVDGNLFIQPGTDSGHPEELVLSTTGESISICVNHKATYTVVSTDISSNSYINEESIYINGVEVVLSTGVFPADAVTDITAVVQAAADTSDIKDIAASFDGTYMKILSTVNSIILEEGLSGINLLTFPSEFDNAAWLDPLTQWTVAANTEIDPVGGSTADVITVTGTTSLIRHNLASDPGIPISYSVWAKVISGSINTFGCDFGDSTSQSLLSQLQAGQWVKCVAPNLANTTANNWLDMVITFDAVGGQIALWDASLMKDGTALAQLGFTSSPTSQSVSDQANIAFRLFLNNLNAKNGENIKPSSISTLDIALTSIATSINVVSTTGFQSSGTLIVISFTGEIPTYEFIDYTSAMDNTINGLTRDNPLDHPAGSIVLVLDTDLPEIAEWVSYRFSDAGSTTLAQNFLLGDTEMELTSVSGLPKQKAGESLMTIPGVIWIENERIEYYERDGTTLKHIRRGTGGTSNGIESVYDIAGNPVSNYIDALPTDIIYASGTIVIDGTQKQAMPGGYMWESSPAGIQSLTSIQANFLKASTGSC